MLDGKTITEVSQFWSGVNHFLWLPGEAIFQFLPVGQALTNAHPQEHYGNQEEAPPTIKAGINGVKISARVVITR